MEQRLMKMKPVTYPSITNLLYRLAACATLLLTVTAFGEERPNIIFRSAKVADGNASFAERKATNWVRDPVHMMDVLPTLMEAAGADYPKQFRDNEIQPLEGTSLLPLLRGEKLGPRTIGFDHQAAHALREGDWKAVYSKRMPEALTWELYNLAEDRCELSDLADKQPQRLASMVSRWEQWATRVGVTWQPYAVPPSPGQVVERDEKQ